MKGDEKMKAKILVPAAIIVITAFSFLFAQGNSVKQMLQNKETQNEAITQSSIIPNMMQNFMNHLSQNSAAMNNMMSWMMNNKNTRYMMMNGMFNQANRDSTLTHSMYNMMNNYPQMWSWMQNMMGRNEMMHRGMMMGSN